MEMKAKTLALVVVVAGAALSFQAHAQSCCPSGGHGVPAATGLGESAPRAANLATDSAWRIYEFQRDGVTYLQINDATGVVRAAVGRINETLWVLPMGKDVARVSLSATPAAPGRVVYQTGDFVVWLRSDAKGDAWVVTSRD